MADEKEVKTETKKPKYKVLPTVIGATVSITGGETFVVEDTADCVKKLISYGITAYLHEAQ